MSACSTINLSGNKISGTLPQSWISMTALENLNLSNNLLEGSVPRIWFYFFPNLEKLDVGDNLMSGTSMSTLSTGLKDLTLTDSENKAIEDLKSRTTCTVSFSYPSFEELITTILVKFVEPIPLPNGGNTSNFADMAYDSDTGAFTGVMSISPTFEGNFDCR